MMDVQLKLVNDVRKNKMENKEEKIRLLINDIKKCKLVIEAEEGIRTDLSFIEIGKILFTKMNEELRSNQDFINRFNIDYLKNNPIEKFLEIFKEANKIHKIFDEKHQEVKLNIKHSDNLLKIVSILQKWNFSDLNEDLNGIVYEIFLRASLRGELGQFFTPREIIDFMVKISNPNENYKILDPASGSGGFLIGSLRHIKDKIKSNRDYSKNIENIFKNHLWGFEIDKELSILAKINLLMNGDGGEHIYNIDTLNYTNNEIHDNFFDLILTNPPFSFPIENRKVLDQFKLGKDNTSEQIDILYVEKCYNLLIEGGLLGIVLPEGLLNLKKFEYFRNFILDNFNIVGSVSLPSGAFLPFGQSNSKTCILFISKGNKNKKGIFFADAVQIGYVCGKKQYLRNKSNDFNFFLDNYFNNNSNNNKEIQLTPFGGRSVFVDYKDINEKRLDAKFYLMQKYVSEVLKSGAKVLQLQEVAEVVQPKINPLKFPEKEFYYLEVPDISERTGAITNIRKVPGKTIIGSKTHFKAGDILFTRLFPDKGRITIVPESIKEGVCSTEIFIIRPKNNSIKKYALLASLKSSLVTNQVKDMISGSSSSRPRLSIDDLRTILIAVLQPKMQDNIEEKLKDAIDNQWHSSQKYLENFKEVMGLFGDEINLNDFRGI